MQDLYGKPIGGAKDFPLTVYQKRQAAILYHYASLDYIKGLVPLVDAVLAAFHGTAKTAQAQGRDDLLKSKRWGSRDTSANATTYGTPFLSELRQGIVKQIADRAFEVYDQTTGFQYAFGGLRELSFEWMTDAEYEHYQKAWDEAYTYARKVDDTMSRQSDWDDSLFVTEWLKFHERFEPLPKFRVRTDVEAETGKKPPRTGVYVPQDDPNGAMQFAWAGGDYGVLTGCRTFDEIGLDALQEVGRVGLWVDQAKMVKYAKHSKFTPVFKEDWGYELIDEDPEIAWGQVAQKSFTKRPCKWYFVEMISGEFDDDAASAEVLPDQIRLRCEAGQACPREGLWSTPGIQGSRYFKQGEVLPVIQSDYGATIWRWDERQ